MRDARRLQKLFFALAGCRRHCATMNFWLVEVLESALESRHDFTLGSECGLLRHSAMIFMTGADRRWTLVCARSGEPPTLRGVLWLSTRPTWAPMASCLPTTRKCICALASRKTEVSDTLLLSRLGSTRITVQNFARDAERFLVQQAVSQIVDSLLPSRAVGVDAPPRQVDRQFVSAINRGRHPCPQSGSDGLSCVA